MSAQSERTRKAFMTYVMTQTIVAKQSFAEALKYAADNLSTTIEEEMTPTTQMDLSYSFCAIAVAASEETNLSDRNTDLGKHAMDNLFDLLAFADKPSIQKEIASDISHALDCVGDAEDLDVHAFRCLDAYMNNAEAMKKVSRPVLSELVKAARLGMDNDHDDAARFHAGQALAGFSKFALQKA
jgi:hypothetical protein